ncbi:MAG TPA: hypothetical protein VKY85_22830 [Candidatus Angelobacter sp.]|nr:hypothetical protein [Candidatus Angelobacter sp.]
MKKTILSTFLLLFAIASWPSGAAAQSLGLAPGEVRQKFKPGVPFEFELATSNEGTTPVEMSVEIDDFWYNEKNEKVFPAPGSAPRSAANWIQFVPEHFEVPAHGSQKMRAIVTPPSDATGGYYAVLFVQSKPQRSFSKSNGQGVFTNMRLGCLVLLDAEKTEDFKIELSSLKLVSPSATQRLDLSFELLNAGNTHVFPVARLAILDAGKKLVAKAQTDEKRFLPGQKDFMHVTWAGSLPPGNYTAVLSVAYGEDQVATQQMAFNVGGP